MTIKQNIQVIKVPLSESEKNRDNREQVFPRMPRLYLELLENKNKIKQDLINKEYSPKKNISPQIENKEEKLIIDNKKDKSFESKLDKFLNNKDDSDRDNDKDDDRDRKKDRDNDKYDDKDRDKYRDDDRDDDRDDARDDDKYNFRNILKNRKKSKKYDEEDLEIDENKDKDDEDEYKSDKYYNKKKKYDNDTDTDTNSTKSSIKETKKKKYKDDDDDSSIENLEDRLNELLDDNSDSSTVITDKKSVKDKYSRQRSYDDNSSVSVINKNPTNLAPSLAELEAQGGYLKKTYLRDINNVSRSEQEEEDLKREILFKFDLLKKSYPNGSIPEYSVHTDYNTMKKSYDDTVRRLSLDSTVDNYKQYLIGGFMACEFLLGNFFNLEMQGFTQQQILSMNQYEKLLIELGEKSYIPTGSKWPVELRLLFMIIINAGVFIVSKMILKKTGANLLGMMNSMNAPKAVQQSRKKMRGPNIDINNLPEES